jgi:DNA-3-methyladenine glycosylase II
MEYIAHLSKDKKLSPIIQRVGPVEVGMRKNIYIRLVSAITSQQLSTKVAAVIYQRFLDLYGGKAPKPQQVLDTAPETLRAIGLSNQKVSYVQNIARFVIDEKLTDAKLHRMGNEEAIAYLTQIKGVGKWTVEMLLMFTLGREDVFPIDDWGIQSAMIELYKIDMSDKKKGREKMLRIAAKWAPYRTYACRYLWMYKDNPPDPGT